jgi:two-component sensor histidine kinase
MINRFYHLPLSRKLAVIVVLTTVAAMLLASAGIVAYEVFTFRHFMVSELETTADIIGSNGSAALRFEVVGDATKILSSLKAKPHISGACFYTPDEQVFATYSRDGGQPYMPALPLQEGYTFTRGYVVAVKHIYHDEDFIGSVHIASDQKILYDTIKQSIVAAILIITACSLLALLISFRVLRVVSRPIDNLVNTANQVSQNQDYSLRATKFADDDLGDLTEEFNDMLQQIQVRDTELEQRVGERTAELSQANVMLTDSLDEKVVLLKEIHHRVKNNLQIISSLLSLQTRHIKDEQALEMFANSGNRIKAMATIHEKLYQSEDLARVDFVEYIQSLVSSLFQTYQVNIENICLKIEVDDILLDLDQAIPCGLMLNELVSNSLKHAFPDDRQGEISVHLGMEDTENYLLVVKDSGVGFPADMDFRSTGSLGLQLINTLTTQLEGRIELDSRVGTEFRIVFPGRKK